MEVALLAGRVAVRDSKDRSGPMMIFDQNQWGAFLADTRSGEFDR